MCLLALTIACAPARTEEAVPPAQTEAPDAAVDAGGAGGPSDASLGDSGAAAIDGSQEADAGQVPDAEAADGGLGDAEAQDAGPADAGVSVCDPASPSPPPPGLGTLWNQAVLSASGPATLGGHGHEDGRPPPGFCAAPRVPGQRVWWLRSVRFETDEDLDGDMAHDPLPKDDSTPNVFYDTYGMGESGGRHHVYAEMIDGSGNRVLTDLEVDLQGGGTMLIAPDPGKPANEFPINVAMWGGNVLTVRVDDPTADSDAVTNLRIPNNHHVNFLLIFQEVVP